MNTLEELLRHQVEVSYNGKQQLMQALPFFKLAAGSIPLKKIFELQQRENGLQRKRLEEIYDRLKMKSTGLRSPVMQGLIDSINLMLASDDSENLRDARLIDAAIQIVHFEIAGYSSCVRYAKELGNIETARLLQQTLDEEYAMETLLSEIAEDQFSDQVA